MNKSDLVETFAIQKQIPLSVADRIVDEIFDYMSETLIANSRIEIRGFGSFENRQHGSYTGRNPKSGELVVIKSKKTPFFKVGKDLKERIKAFHR